MLTAQQWLDGGCTVVDDQNLEGPVVLQGNLADGQAGILFPVAREHDDGGERAPISL